MHRNHVTDWLKRASFLWNTVVIYNLPSPIINFYAIDEDCFAIWREIYGRGVGLKPHINFNQTFMTGAQKGVHTQCPNVCQRWAEACQGLKYTPNKNLWLKLRKGEYTWYIEVHTTSKKFHLDHYHVWSWIDMYGCQGTFMTSREYHYAKLLDVIAEQDC